ncbi:MAG TPA: VWA domain-containing protein [Sulfurovum sp. UBA12169]|nr:MAG TPA: VWA domain-containing protein [Sulfurovum sp. UBA12169]
MSFVYPYLFWVLVVPFALFAVLILTNKERLSRVFDEKVLERLSATKGSVPLAVRHMLMFVALFFMIVAMARPVIEKGDKLVSVEGLHLLVGLDISGSMRSQDQYPNRLEFAKKKIESLFDAMPSDEIGVLAFAHSSFMVAPFTADKETLKEMIKGVDENYINMSSTDFESLAALSVQLLEHKSPKILIVFTDGGDKEALGEFAEILKSNDVDLYAVLLGTAKGAPVIDEKGKPLTQQDGSIAITQRNDALLEVAKNSEGMGVIASNSKEDIEKLVTKIRSKYKNQQQGEVKIKERSELFYYPLGLGLLLLLIALSSIPGKTANSKPPETGNGGKK